MTDTVPAGARSSPHVARNREPILAVLSERLAAEARVLEVASGTGEHAAFFSAALPGVTWTPSDPDSDARASIAAWRTAAGSPNLAAPVVLDAADPATWPAGPFEAIFCANMIHISPWSSCEGLMALAGRVLAPGGRLFLYGPFFEADVETAPSNLTFDQSLRSRDAAWGIRNLADVTAEAARNGLRCVERIAMPANNLVLVFEKTA